MTRSFLLLFLTVALTLAGCYEAREGCLDISAVNFAVDADRACSDCCQYPLLRLDVQHRAVYADTVVNFRLEDSVYFDRNEHPFRVKDIRYYVSGLRFVMADGSEAGVTDEITLQVYNDEGTEEEATLADDFSLVTPSRVQSYSIGTLRTSGSFTGIRFTLGLSPEANRAVPSSLPTDHPLAPQPSDLYWSPDSGYVFNRIELYRDTTAADTLTTVLEIGTDPYRREVTLPVSGVLPEGRNIRIILRVDYLTWFGAINDVKNDPEVLLIETIVGQLAQSFSVVDIKAELP